MVRVLVVEDETILAVSIQRGLELEAIAADIAGDGGAAIEALTVNDYDVVILDRDLPVLHGDEVCRFILASFPGIRVLMLTAARRTGDTVEGLMVGADDYLTKPFQFTELVARVRALHRRSGNPVPPTLIFGTLALDTFRREVTRAGRIVELSRKEFSVLEILMRAGGGIVSAETLLEKAWDENADQFSNSVRVTISTLRHRLGEPGIINTVRGVGYRIQTEQ